LQHELAVEGVQGKLPRCVHALAGPGAAALATAKLAAMQAYFAPPSCVLPTTGMALFDPDGLLAVGPDAQGRQRVVRSGGAWR
jgi:hypothetical protein